MREKKYAKATLYLGDAANVFATIPKAKRSAWFQEALRRTQGRPWENFLIIPIEPGIKADLEAMARAEGQTLEQFVLQEILSAVRGFFYTCQHCGTFLADGRKIVVEAPEITFTCPQCGQESRFKTE